VSGLVTDTVSERTAAGGVSIDGVTLKDQALTGATIFTDTISERTSASGVTVDGVLLKDQALTGATIFSDTITELTNANGVLIEDVPFKDGGITIPSGGNIFSDTISERTASSGISVDGVTLKDGGVTIPSGATLTVDSGGSVDINAVLNAIEFSGSGMVYQIGSALMTAAYSRVDGDTWLAVPSLSVSLTKTTTTSTFIIIANVNGDNGSGKAMVGIGSVIPSGSLYVWPIADADGLRKRSYSLIQNQENTILLTRVYSPSTTGTCTFSVATGGRYSASDQYINRHKKTNEQRANTSSRISVIEIEI